MLHTNTACNLTAHIQACKAQAHASFCHSPEVAFLWRHSHRSIKFALPSMVLLKVHDDWRLSWLSIWRRPIDSIVTCRRLKESILADTANYFRCVLQINLCSWACKEITLYRYFITVYTAKLVAKVVLTKERGYLTELCHILQSPNAFLKHYYNKPLLGGDLGVLL